MTDVTVRETRTDGTVECACVCGVIFVSTLAAVEGGQVTHCGCKNPPPPPPPAAPPLLNIKRRTRELTSPSVSS